MNVHNFLLQSDVAIVKHTYTPTGGAEQELLRYLLPKAKSVAYVSHPFPDARRVPLNTTVSYYKNGRLEEEIRAPLVLGPSPIFFAKDVALTLWYLRKYGKFQLYIGVDNLNARSGLMLKRLGIVKRVVYYVIDYAPYRFSSRTGQALYRMLDRACCYRSDAVWNVSASMEQARASDGVVSSRCAPQIEVPLGARYSEIPRLPHDKVNPNLIVFLGSITREQGLDIMIRAMLPLRQAIPDVRLRVVGDGPELPSLKRLAAQHNVSGAIEFLGFIENDDRAAELAAEGSVGIAPYPQAQDTYKRFADPGKVKIYLAAGLPVVISRVPPVAALIEKSGAGIVVEPNADSLAETLRTLLSTPEKLREMRANAAELGKRFDWEVVFDRAFERTLKFWR